ncbi:alkane 1-monooxygenase [Streptomyces noursei]|uniref:alkane 1-monooxygenase n=1 Tax=Streptomyces noursei TaxID=1971 RepID=UPI0016753956|nr:alkane 1-monooxygenase [Streptomyces noursei]MCZ1014084.1 alkane 1-monooxygenase [Streptomyces noursei]
MLVQKVPERFVWPVATLAPGLPLLALPDLHPWAGDWGWWLPLATALVAVPMADWLTGAGVPNGDGGARSGCATAYHRWCLYLFIPLQYLSLAWACSEWASPALSFADRVGLAFGVGWVGALGLNVGHELGHSGKTAERRLSRVAFAQVAYGHFLIAHNRIHHVRVATPADPSSSRLGEGFWRFLPRVVACRVIEALRSEAQRLARRGRRVWHPHNGVLRGWAVTAVLYAVFPAEYGFAVFPWLLVQAVAGVCVLETVAYLEHYGLLRTRRPDGRYEQVGHQHSWNNNSPVATALLFNAQRHSDHHVTPLRPYPELRHLDHAPLLPAGWVAIMALAWMPPLWRRVMDPRVVSLYDGDVTKANVHPPAQKRLLARYGAAAVTPCAR